MSSPLLAFSLACATSVVLILVLRPMAMSVGLVDVPDARKSHHGAVPLVGGIAVFAAVLGACLVPVLAGVAGLTPAVLTFLGASLLLVCVGVADDFFELSPGARFVAQAAATLAMIFGAGVALVDLGTMTFSGRVLGLGLLAVPFTIFTTVGVINALNMCDGLDGLSGSQALISLGGFGLAMSLWGDPAGTGLITALAGGLVGFLLFNMRLPGRARASIFLGDAGSMFLGFALTWFAISLSQGPERVIRPAAALWFIMVPIIDAVAMMLRRIVKGRSPFASDREHLHHIFMLAGFSVNQTVAIMAALAAAGVAVGLAVQALALPDVVVAGVFLAVGLLYFWMIMHSWRVMRFLHRSICRRRGKGADRRVLADRRRGHDAAYSGPERRSGLDRRTGLPRRSEDAALCRPYPPPARLAAQPAMARVALDPGAAQGGAPRTTRH